jgi:hypothetical protein
MVILMDDKLLFNEKLTSNRTFVIFVVLTVFFSLLLVWRVSNGEIDGLAIAFAFFFVVFLFYSVNYRTLIIRLTPEFLKLSFGIFTWTVAINNIEACSLDEVPAFMRNGGAGIHFMFIRRRYRASFNFLEYPRVVITLKKKVGPVREISFSTCRPDDILVIIPNAVHENLSIQ